MNSRVTPPTTILNRCSGRLDPPKPPASGTESGVGRDAAPHPLLPCPVEASATEEEPAVDPDVAPLDAPADADDPPLAPGPELVAPLAAVLDEPLPSCAPDPLVPHAC